MTAYSRMDAVQLDSARAMVALAPVPMLLLQQDRVLQASAGWHRLIGWQWLADDRLAHWEAQLGLAEGVLAAEGPQRAELTLRGGSGQLRHCELLRSELPLIEGGSLQWLVFNDHTDQHCVEQALEPIVASVSQAQGADFLDRLTESLCESLQLDAALVAEVDSNYPGHMLTRSFWLDGAHHPPFRYSLAGTPCEQVLGKQPCFFASDVRRQFPGDIDLQRLQVESYLGFPLADSRDGPLGVIVLLSRRPMQMSDGHQVLLKFIAQRVAVELERQIAEDRLAASELGLNVAERLARLGSWVVDIERQMVRVSEQMACLYQLRPVDGEVPRSETISRIHPEDRDYVRRAIEIGEQGGDPYTFTHRILLPDGQTRWVRSQAEPRYDGDGQLRRIFGVSHDITELTRSQRLVYESEHRQHRLIAACPYGITQVDKELRFVYVNSVAEQLYGYGEGELYGRSVRDVVPADQWPEVEQLFRRLLDEKPHVESYRRRARTRQGGYRELDITLNYILDEDGQVQGFIGFLTDVTEQMATDTRLRQLSTAVEQSPASVLITDRQGRIEYVNPAFEQTTGYRLDEVCGQTPTMLKYGSERRVYREMRQALSQGRPWRGEMLNRRRDGSLFWELASVAPIKGADGQVTHYVSINEDISRLKSQEAQLAYQANYDPVTDLPNRILALDRLEQVIAASRLKQRHAAVMFVDLDQFKRVNDSFGHSAGDQLLVRAAQLLKGAVLETDTVARFGGDEFVIILDRMPSLEKVEAVAERLLRAFSKPVYVGDHELMITASIGVAVYPQDGDNAESLLSNADAAMYTAKERGRNCCHFFTRQMNEQARQRLLIESHLQRALEFNELSLHYQPVVALDSGRVVGCEALLRWHSPSLGMVPPDRFISLAEDLGLISELGEWVIDRVLQQYARWRELLPAGFRCAINVSPKQFQRGRLAAFLLDRLDRYGVPGTAVELEVTERLLMHHWPEVDEQISLLNDAGVAFSIDDFGTGYSSISYLRKYPFNTLKIDRSFVCDLLSDPDDRALVLSVIAMAQGLGLEIIAEGVETIEQARFLRDAQCSMMQGYLFSKPLPAEQMEQLLVSDRRMTLAGAEGASGAP
ncbi:bifunctional diguanylate cyclase/phosphodiesterase [Marinobacterium arenosum]|uniref:bifunctional diguanylate cyclase/phosphodiesterase n=1 Tax=Marinobacterium arenosum TaxID=2862496 RepID=UPI001C947A25|nr:EAL domain-containing protein [Marinobacterium arenosum]MBY4678491.1 EAL domain-containing protein [Marinobacterium arenosum]